MALGSGIFLIVIGAILAFAVNVETSVVDLQVIGWICIAAGVIALIVSLVANAQARRTTHREIVEQPGSSESDNSTH